MQRFPTPMLAHASDSGTLPRSVSNFIRQLRCVPVGLWAAAAEQADPRAAMASASRTPAATSLEAAHAQLRRTAATMPALAALTQTRVQNLVEVAASCLSATEAAAMKRVALAAALALAVRDEIGDELFARLYEPFATLIPLDEEALAESTC